MDAEETIYRLWKLLDDIDTLDDAAKSNDLVFREAVRKVQRKRFDVVSDKAIQPYYDKFYSTSPNNV